MPMPSVAAQVEDRREEHATTAELVAETAEHEAADRPGKIADRERRERHHQGDERILARKKGAADLRREDAEDHEVVVLERAAEAGEQNHPPGAPGHRHAAHSRMVSSPFI